MFKKLITLVMAMSIFTVSAQASTQNGLKAAFDELNYALTVEWDQKDQKFYGEKMGEFSEATKQLMAQGLTNEELVAFAKSQVKNEQAAKDLETALSMISINKMNPEEARAYMIETMNKSYSAGASWNGASNLLAAIGILFLVSALAVGGGYTYSYYSCSYGYSYVYCGCNPDYYGCTYYCCY